MGDPPESSPSGATRLTVMYVDHTAQLSGGEIALCRLLSALREYINPIVVLGEHGPLEGELRSQGIEVITLPLEDQTRTLRKDTIRGPVAALKRLASVWSYAWALRKLIRQHGVDVVHTNSLKAGFYGCIAARLSGVPAVWHLRDRLATDYLPPFALVVTRLALVVLPTTIICNSESTLETIDWPWLPKRLFSAVVAASPIPDVLESSEMSRRLGAVSRPHQAFTIAMVGRITPWKGQLIVVRAFSEARLPESAVLVLMGSPMFGEDAYLAEIEQEVARRGLTGRVQLRGFVSDVLTALSRVDVLVHASTSPEPFGQVIVEGMAAGVPVVATRGGGPSEIITDGVDGLLYEAGDAARLAELVTVLHEDATLRDRLRVNGLIRARDFTPASIAPRVYEQYVRVAGK